MGIRWPWVRRSEHERRIENNKAAWHDDVAEREKQNDLLRMQNDKLQAERDRFKAQFEDACDENQGLMDCQAIVVKTISDTLDPFGTLSNQMQIVSANLMSITKELAKKKKAKHG